MCLVFYALGDGVDPPIPRVAATVTHSPTVSTAASRGLRVLLARIVGPPQLPL